MTVGVEGPLGSAWLSMDHLYRYCLIRDWGHGERMTFIMLNPSTADANVDDPTIRRCMGFAKRERCTGIQVINVFALRVTKPKHLLDHPDPEGPDNSSFWSSVLYERGPKVAAWGNGVAMVQEETGIVSKALDDHPDTDWLCLGHTKGYGEPKHPLYLPADTPLVPL